MLIFWLDSSNLSKGLTILQNSMMACKQYVNSGYFHQSNRILFITDNHNDTVRAFNHGMIQRHSRTAVLEQVQTKLALYRSLGFISMISHEAKTHELKQVNEYYSI